MRKYALVIAVVLIVVIVLIGPVSAIQSADPSTPTPLLRLQRGTFDARDQASLSSGQTLSAPANGPYAIIQLKGPVALDDRRALQQTGVKLLEYIPDYAYLVSGTPAQIATAARLPQVYARVPFTLADKLSPGMLRAIQRGDVDMGRVSFVGWRDDTGRMGRDLNTLPFNARSALTQNQLLQAAELESVRWVERAGQPFIINDYARTIMGVDGLWQNAPLYGNGQIIGITDTGLDTGNLSTISPDFAGRIAATQVLTVTGDLEDECGHGTHVAGSAAGAGVQSGAVPGNHDYTNSFAGVAPEAQLAIQAFEAPGCGEVLGIPDDFYTLFDLMYSTGARIHSNSWGDITGGDAVSPEYGGYINDTRRTDAFIWDHPDMTVFFGAGNSGQDCPFTVLGFCQGYDGVIDPDSLLSPGTAKNVVTVGATESTKDEGPAAGYTWFLVCLFNCLGDPITSDPIANDVNGMAAFSSRGPTDDGRYKPDIVAPGVNIVSNASHAPGATPLWGPYVPNPDYVYSGGTSMATPLTAGIGALVREWLQLQGATVPSAALVKATLLNTTTDIYPGQYGEGAAQEIPSTPSSVAGWGRANVGFMDPLPGFALWFDDHSQGLNTNDIVTYTHAVTQPLRVLTDTQPLRAMLVWTDPPGSLSAGPKLVNDLDLSIAGPGGTTYYGNYNATGDRLNNVEGIVIDSPPMGQYTVTVSAFNVPTATQPFALVMSGLLSDAADLRLAKDDGGATAAPGDTITYTLNYVNKGFDTAAGVVITETVPSNTSFDSASSTPGWTCVPNDDAGSVCTFSVGSIASNASGTITYTVNVSTSIQGTAAQIDNTASIGDDGARGLDLSPSNNIATDVTPLSNIASRCGLTASSYLFNDGGKDVTIAVNTLGDIECVQVSLTNSTHVSATTAMTDNYYWSISANNAGGSAASGYSVDLTFPHISTDTISFPPRVCRLLGATGWDCAGTHPYNATSVVRPNVTAFSDWTIAYKAGPTAVRLRQLAAAEGPSSKTILGLGLLGLTAITSAFGAGRILRKRRR
jgi:uncharacterized repeat protein (TIGR01451 family)